MMEIPIEYPGFEGRGLSIRMAGMFSGAKIVLDGSVVPAKKNTYSVRDNDGKEVKIKLKLSLDPFPPVEIEDKTIRVVEPLKWYQYVWNGLPIIMLIRGGAIGGALGVAALWFNMVTFRRTGSSVMKYVATAMVSIGAFTLWLVIGLVISVAFDLE